MSKFRQTLSSKRFVLPFIIIFAAVGAYLLFHSFAAGFSISQETETATVTAPASVVTDSAASGGKAITFGAASSGGGGGTVASCPSSSPVQIQTTDNAQNIVNAHSAGTVYMIMAGVHSGFSVVPHTGDTFCAQAGAILDGGNSTANAFAAFGNSAANNVTIMGNSATNLMEIRNYNATSDPSNDFHGPIEMIQGDGCPTSGSSRAKGWTVEYTNIHNNQSVGITPGDNTLVENNEVDNNVSEGVSGGCNQNDDYEHNEIFNNNPNNVASCNNEAGGFKVSEGVGTIYNNNYAHNNSCDGLWNDLGFKAGAGNNKITNNILVDNGGGGNNSSNGSGEQFEISNGCTISGNYVSGNNFGDPTNFYVGGQIFLSNSENCTVSGNTIIGAKGVILVDDTRSECTPTQCPTTNDTITNNDFYFTGSGLVAGGQCASSVCSNMTNDTWSNNRYHMSNTSASAFSWTNGTMSKSGWQALGFDTNSTFDTNTTPPPQPAWSLASGTTSTGGSTTYGSAKATVSATSAGNYVVWSRIMAPDTTNQGYGLSIDGGANINVGGTGITPNTWTWVKYQNGNTTSTITANLTAGNHTLTLTGTQPSVKVDRVLLLTDTTCTPTGTGDNCLAATPPPPSNTPPTVVLSTSSAGVTQGQSVTLSATATDNASSTITSVSFYDGSTLIGTDTTAPYSVAWNTTTSTAVGDHSITAKATDALSLTGVSGATNVSVRAPSAPPPPPSNATTVRIAAGSSTNYTDTNGNVWNADTDFTGGSTFANTVTTTGTTDPALYNNERYSMSDYNIPLANGTYTLNLYFSETIASLCTAGARVFSVSANNATILSNYDIFAKAGCNAADKESSTVTVTNGNLDIHFTAGTQNPKIDAIEVLPAQTDTTAPTATITSPTNGQTISGNVNVEATATDNVSVSRVELYLDGASTPVSTLTSAPYNFGWNTLGVANGTHTLQVKAYDAAGNVGSSAKVSVTVNNVTAVKLSPPTNLVATTPSPTQVTLTWTASPTSGVTGYLVQRNGVTIADTATVPGTSPTAYVDSTVSSGTTYSYTVLAHDNANNVSAASTAVSVTTPKTPPPPPTTLAPPTKLTATSSSPTQVNLSWTASTSTGVVGYKIFRNGNQIGVSTTTSYGDGTVVANTTYSYYVEAYDGLGNVSVASNTVSPVATPLPTIRINTGGPSYTDNSGNVWSADGDFSGGHTDDQAAGHVIKGTENTALFQDERWGKSTYTLPIPNGVYTVRLDFAEIYSSCQSVGCRIFNVSLNGKTFLNHFDIYAKVGGYTADTEQTVTTVTNGQLVIKFSPVKQQPQIAAIEVVPASTGK